MITKKTLFILGAGASKPYGYPTGAGLGADICNNFVQQYKQLLGEEDRRQNRLPNNVLIPRAERFVKDFEKISDEISIDQFLSANPDHDEIGRMAIATAIYHYERNSTWGQDWYALLFREMTEGLHKPDDYKRFSENNVRFITFNYDRSLEEYLYDKLLAHYRERLIDRNELLGIRIDDVIPFGFVHMYGCFAEPTWRGAHRHRERLSYDSLWSLKDNIKVIYDERNGSSHTGEIGMLFDWAERIFFLGFGYGNENMKRFGNLITNWKDKTLYGTAVGSSEGEVKGIIEKLKVVLRGDKPVPHGPKPIITSVDCYTLLREHLLLPRM